MVTGVAAGVCVVATDQPAGRCAGAGVSRDNGGP